jgi:tetratricopeptide (TPR) repeat protein
MEPIQIGLLITGGLAAGTLLIVRSIKKNNSDKHIIEGNRLSKLQKYDKAKTAYEKALKLNKYGRANIGITYNNLIMCEFMLKNFDNAIFYAEKALNYNGNNTVTLAMLGKVIMKRATMKRLLKFGIKK